MWWWLFACGNAVPVDTEPITPVLPAVEVADTDPPDVPKPHWPAEGTHLVKLTPEIPKTAAPFKVIVDAGHGARWNPGNTSTRCEPEQDFTARTSLALAERLAAYGGLTVRNARTLKQRISYDRRLKDWAAWPADAVISLHSDARVGENPPGTNATTGCLEVPDAQGFAILFSDESPDPVLNFQRQRLAELVGDHMLEAGFYPYDGATYGGLYGADPGHPGVFVDRHEPSQRIKMLRRSRVPLVIVETHHALDPIEPDRWDEAETLDAFSGAIAAALEAFREPLPAGVTGPTGLPPSQVPNPPPDWVWESPETP